MDSLDAVFLYPNGTSAVTTSPICKTVMGLDTCSPLLLASFELFIYVALCTSILFRYRHHVLHYIYRDSPRAISPQTPNEAIILITLSSYLFLTNASSIARSSSSGSSCHDLLPIVLYAVIAALDWREESQFQLFLAQHQQLSTLQAESHDSEKAEPACVELDGKPAPTATNIHVQYQLRTSIKALLAYAALVVTQLDFARTDEMPLWTAVWGVPVSMVIGTVYLLRAAVLLVQGERFRRGSGAVRL